MPDKAGCNDRHWWTFPIQHPAAGRDIMGKTIVGTFPTRRQVELAVEHLVQEYGLERADIFIESGTGENSAGVRRAGADAKRDTAAGRDDTAPDLNGSLLISVDLNEDDTDSVEKAFREAGATDFTVALNAYESAPTGRPLGRGAVHQRSSPA